MNLFRRNDPGIQTLSSSLLSRFKAYFAAVGSHSTVAVAAVLVLSGSAAAGTLLYKNSKDSKPDLVVQETIPPETTPTETESTADDQNAPTEETKPPETAPAPAPIPKSPAPPKPTPAAPSSTLPPGSSLPSDATCASRVKSAVETRPANAAFNATKGNGANGRYPRVTGNYTGTTDEIIQWTACKWGIDENIVRAQAAKESWWFQRTAGDFTTNTDICVPGHRTLGADGVAGKCPESIGIMQVRYQYHLEAFANNNATNSTAYNLDYAYAGWRDCFEGNTTWLNTVERGATYGAGDAWGCVGVWFSGRWMTQPAVDYINAVKDYYNQKIWEQSYFKSAT